MKVLLVHPDDNFPGGQWDLIVDLGRAPASTYEKWAGEAGCRALSVFEFSNEADDLSYLRRLMQSGTGVLIDQYGIDWWDVLSFELVPQLYQAALVHRLAAFIGGKCDLYCTRPDYRCSTLHRLTGGKLINLERPYQAKLRRLAHYNHVISTFSPRQLLQIAQDKFDRDLILRRFLARRPKASHGRPVLLPSAYINVSRTAVSYASLLPGQKFLLACARDSAKVRELPANVQTTSLDGYFARADKNEIKPLLKAWQLLRARLMSSAPEFECAETCGFLDRMPSLLAWGLRIRDAWTRLFESEDIAGCFCADLNNPYTRVALLLAQHAGLPNLACHHGALDATMGIKSQHPDTYLAKSSMERDYMERACGIRPEQISRPGSLNSARVLQKPFDPARPQWLVFFSEPYGIDGWRMDDIYRELIPHLYSLAEERSLKVVLKLHPFETVKGHRRLLRRILPPDWLPKIEIVSGPPGEELWRNTAIAVTVQSSVAVDCAGRGIPVFLCGWLRDLLPGYVRQYQKFGVGHVLNTAAQIAGISALLNSRPQEFKARPDFLYPVASEVLRELLTGSAPARLQLAARA